MLNRPFSHHFKYQFEEPNLLREIMKDFHKECILYLGAEGGETLHSKEGGNSV